AKAQILEDKSNIPEAKTNMIETNPDYISKKEAVTTKYGSQIKELESKISALSNEGNFQEADKLEAKVKKLVKKQGEEERSLIREYEEWADGEIEKWTTGS
ncbi:MAG: hypothetical protein ACXADH_17730, partial [Candidatus Kariarchaeaceae archaeon]